MRPVAPSRRNEKNRVRLAMGTPAAAVHGDDARALERDPRQAVEIGLPAPAVVRYETPCGFRPALHEALLNLDPDLEGVRSMAGPSHASSSPGGAASAATLASKHAPSSPRQPACATAMRVPPRSVSTTGSSPRSAPRRPGAARLHMPASARGGVDAAPSWQTTSVPCTCSSQRGSPGRCAASRSSSRFAATERGSSPTCAARFSDAYGPLLVPPPRQSGQHPDVRRRRPVGSIQTDGRRGHAANLVAREHIEQPLHVVRQPGAGTRAGGRSPGGKTRVGRRAAPGAEIAQRCRSSSPQPRGKARRPPYTRSPTIG